MRDELDKMSDPELSECFAREIAGWSLTRVDTQSGVDPENPNYLFPRFPSFATSADAVLPFATKYGGCFKYISAVKRFTYFKDANCIHPCFYDGEGEIARAACIALIRAKRATK